MTQCDAFEEKAELLMCMLQDRRMFRTQIKRTAEVLGCEPHEIVAEAKKRVKQEDLPRWYVDIHEILDKAGIASTDSDGVHFSPQARVRILRGERDSAVQKCIEMVMSEANCQEGNPSMKDAATVLHEMAGKLKRLIK